MGAEGLLAWIAIVPLAILTYLACSLAKIRLRQIELRDRMIEMIEDEKRFWQTCASGDSDQMQSFLKEHEGMKS